jgi:hypothetical protein
MQRNRRGDREPRIPLWGEGEKDLDGLSKSEIDMDFVRRTMLSAQVQDVVARVEMVGQDLLLTANGDDSACTRSSLL